MSQNLSPTQIIDMLVKLPPGGKIEVEKSHDGDFTVSDNTPPTKTQLIQQKYSHLAGQGISITDAADKYGIPRGAIKGWVYQSGYIHFVDQDAYPQLIDESEVALCADIYRRRQATGTSGLPYFDERDAVIQEVKRPASSRKPRKKG